MLNYQQQILTLVDNALNDEGKYNISQIESHLKVYKKLSETKSERLDLTTEGFEPSLFRTGSFLSKA